MRIRMPYRSTPKGEVVRPIIEENEGPLIFCAEYKQGNLEVALNLKHKPGECLIPKLAGDEIEFMNLDEVPDEISVYGVWQLDDWHYDRTNEFKIHTSNPSFIALLERTRRSRLAGRVGEDDLIEEINKDPELLGYALTLKGERLWPSLCELNELNKQYNHELDDSSQLREVIKKLRGLGYSNVAQKLAQDIPQPRPVLRDFTTLAEVNRRFEEGEFTEMYVEHQKFPGLRRMPSTLHSRANSQYDPNIVSFVCSEEWVDFRERRTIVNNSIDYLISTYEVE